MHVIVAYDIPEDSRRNRLARNLLKFLDRVQKSVFEGEIRDSRYEEMRRAILASIDPSEDSVRIYHLCARCEPATEVIGLTYGLGAADDMLLF